MIEQTGRKDSGTTGHDEGLAENQRWRQECSDWYDPNAQCQCQACDLSLFLIPEFAMIFGYLPVELADSIEKQFSFVGFFGVEHGSGKSRVAGTASTSTRKRDTL